MLCFLLSIVDENKKEKVKYLYHKYFDRMISFAKSSLIAKNDSNFDDDACDVVQNTFLKLLQYMPDQVEYERSYVFKILTNEIYKFLNKEKYYEDIDDYEDMASEEEFEEIVIAENDKEIIAKIIYDLDERLRVPIVMKYEFEMSAEEIAQQLDIAVRSVYARLDKAYALIKKEYDKKEGQNGRA